MTQMQSTSGSSTKAETLDLNFEARSYDFQRYVDSKNWIGGKWTDAKSGKTIEVHNPRHGEVLGTVPWSVEADVDAAVATVGADFCEEFNNYLPRKGSKIASLPGLSIGITYILPAPKEAPKL